MNIRVDSLNGRIDFKRLQMDIVHLDIMFVSKYKLSSNMTIRPEIMCDNMNVNDS